MNLLEETKQKLAEYGKTLEDVVWIGISEYKVYVEKFIELADVEYDDGYGSAKVATNILVVGKDFWLERHEYDGSEWWEYKLLLKEPNQWLDLSALTVGQSKYDVSVGWETLEKLNGIK